MVAIGINVLVDVSFSYNTHSSSLDLHPSNPGTTRYRRVRESGVQSHSRNSAPSLSALDRGAPRNKYGFACDPAGIIGREERYRRRDVVRFSGATKRRLSDQLVSRDARRFAAFGNDITGINSVYTNLARRQFLRQLFGDSIHFRFRR